MMEEGSPGNWIAQIDFGVHAPGENTNDPSHEFGDCRSRDAGPASMLHLRSATTAAGVEEDTNWATATIVSKIVLQTVEPAG
jgi:hypothetical protein